MSGESLMPVLTDSTVFVSAILSSNSSYSRRLHSVDGAWFGGRDLTILPLKYNYRAIVYLTNGLNLQMVPETPGGFSFVHPSLPILSLSRDI